MATAEQLGIMTGIRAGRLVNRGSILDGTVGIMIFASISKPDIWANPFSYPMGTH
jgi:hypothetical protein